MLNMLGPGFAIAMILWIPLSIWIIRRTTMRVKVDIMQRLPMTLEQIDADKDVIRAHHMIDLRQLELKIAEAQASEAEANARSQEGLTRIDKLNRRLEVLQLKLAAKGVKKDIRKVDEELIRLDSARNSVEA